LPTASACCNASFSGPSMAFSGSRAFSSTLPAWTKTLLRFIHKKSPFFGINGLSLKSCRIENEDIIRAFRQGSTTSYDYSKHRLMRRCDGYARLCHTSQPSSSAIAAAMNPPATRTHPELVKTPISERSLVNITKGTTAKLSWRLSTTWLSTSS
jgi:hypothetical protein